jgi:hypothetical protein
MANGQPASEIYPSLKGRKIDYHIKAKSYFDSSIVLEIRDTKVRISLDNIAKAMLPFDQIFKAIKNTKAAT